MNAIRKFLDLNNKGRKLVVSVVGDLLVDEYYYVNANRVSPEFPIPIMQAASDWPELALPGGAGNVCMQFKHFNAEVQLFAFVDQTTQYLLEENGIDTSNCVLLPSPYRNPVKKRYYQGEFPLCRIDIESPNYGMDVDWLKRCQRRLHNFFEKDAKKSDVVIFSDYNKGVFSDAGLGPSIWTAYDSAITIVDPKTGPIEKWKGCSIIKPNAKEAREISGKKDWQAQCDFFKDKTDCTAVVITQGGDGVVGKVLDGYFEYIPERKVSADSVIGAGDCFVAFMGMALARNIDIMDAVELAFEAGALYVQQKHNKPVSPLALCGKFASPEWLVERDYKLVFTNGCFDVLHPGHLHTLRYAKSHGDKLVVAINSDASVKKLKGESRPVHSLATRAEMLAALEFVDYVVNFDEETPLKLIQQIKPDKICKGGDYQKEKVVGAQVVGVDNVIIAPYMKGHSTTSIIEKNE